jgi:predicted nucleic acid-binding protein
MRVVVDTNVFVSAILKDSSVPAMAYAARLLWRDLDGNASCC